MSHPHLVLLQPESVRVDGRRRKLSDEGFGLAQPRLKFLKRLPEPSHQDLSLLQSREPLAVALTHRVVAAAQRIRLHLREELTRYTTSLYFLQTNFLSPS